MRRHCAKCKKCVRTAPNAKKCGTCGKTQKVRDFCAAHNHIFSQGVKLLLLLTLLLLFLTLLLLLLLGQYNDYVIFINITYNYDYIRSIIIVNIWSIIFVNSIITVVFRYVPNQICLICMIHENTYWTTHTDVMYRYNYFGWL